MTLNLAAVMFAVLCGLMFLALFATIWFRKNWTRRPIRKFLGRSVLCAAAVWGMLDAELQFSIAQAVTANGDTASTNVYDSGGANGQGDSGQTGENLWVNVVVNTTATTGSGATVQAVLQDSADNATFNDVVAGAVNAIGAVVAGAVLLQLQPPVGMRRYWRIAYRVGTGTLTAGKFDSYISNTIQRNVARPSGFSVS